MFVEYGVTIKYIMEKETEEGYFSLLFFIREWSSKMLYRTAVKLEEHSCVGPDILKRIQTLTAVNSKCIQRLIKFAWITTKKQHIA